MTAQPATLDVSYRNIGAITGALLGLAAVGILYLVTWIPEVESVLLIRTVLSGDGLFPSGSIPLAMVGVPPLSAAIAGWLVAPRAMAGDQWSGVAMGATTYFAANLLGPTVAYGISTETPFVELVAGAAIVGVFASFLLFPLLLVCVVAGSAWAKLLRVVARLPDAQSLPSRPFPGLAILLGAGVLAVGWLPLAFMVGGLFSGGAWVD